MESRQVFFMVKFRIPLNPILVRKVFYLLSVVMAFFLTMVILHVNGRKKQPGQ